MVSIDQLPTLVPREASTQFSADFLPSLLEIHARKSASVWTNAEKVFREKVKEAAVIEGL